MKNKEEGGGRGDKKDYTRAIILLLTDRVEGKKGKPLSLTSGAQRNHRGLTIVLRHNTLYLSQQLKYTARCNGDGDVGANERGKKAGQRGDR